MHITRVELKNFKRFTDLTIDGIPNDAKLVLLIGSNGSGKSSVFDAFEIDNSRRRIPPFSTNETALRRSGNAQESNKVNERLLEYKKSSLIEGDPEVKITTDLRPKYSDGTYINEVEPPTYPREIDDTSGTIRYYGRTSFRQVSRLVRRQVDGASISERDFDRPLNFIDRDNRFENDIDRISGQILRELFRDTSTAEQIRLNYIGAINGAFERIFGETNGSKLSIYEILPPLEEKPPQLNFRKGNSEIPYDYLSAGEKEVVNILINLLARRDQYTDAVYFFDEIDLHLNTQLQFNLIKEIVENWIPENCQFWTASHSLGFIDYARQYDKGVIIDFDSLDFDQSQTLFPQPKEVLDVYDIAVPKEMLFKIMPGKKVVVCENKNDEYFNLLGLSDTIFVGMKDSQSVFLHIKNDPRYHSIRDRDFLSDTEIERINVAYPNHHILRYYNFENYLYHPDNLAELDLPDFDRAVYISKITALKRERYDYILPSLVSSRQTYEEFKTKPKLKDETIDSIVDDFRSNDFERFYKYFNMKGQYERVDPSLWRITHKRLVQTNWFRGQIDAIVNG